MPSNGTPALVSMKIISLGEVLFDEMDTGQAHMGGAPFNFAVHARTLGHQVLFLSAVGLDERGDLILARMRELGLQTRLVTRAAEHPTGIMDFT